jgi:hypothetical protein
MANKNVEWAEMNFENLKEEDVGEEVKFTFRKDAFKDKKLHCDVCGFEMKKIKTSMNLPNTDLRISLDLHKCKKCDVEYLNGEQAKKFDRALMIAKALSKDGLLFERSLNSDGDNYIFRFPAQLTKGWKKHQKVDINPLSSTDFLVKVKD